MAAYSMSVSNNVKTLTEPWIAGLRELGVPEA